MKLSKENYNKIMSDGIYEADYKDFIGQQYYPFHCKNWTFIPNFCGNEIMMIDTYFNNSGYELTDDNFDKFKFVVLKKDIVRVQRDKYETFADDDKFCLALDSSGLSCENQYWGKIGSKPSKERLLGQLREHLKSAKRKVEALETDIKEIEQGTFYGLRPVQGEIV